MRKFELDRLLEKAVADALGVPLTRRRPVHATLRHEHKAAPRRQRHTVRELHPA